MAGLCLLAVLVVGTFPAHAQVQYPLNSTGVMSVTLNGEFVVSEEDLRVKVPGGHVRINRDFDGVQWTVNRQWSGLHSPRAARAFYASVGTYMSCTIYDGINSCDRGSGTALQLPSGGLDALLKNRGSMRILNDEDFSGGETPEALPEFVTRKGAGFSISSDRSSYNSNDYPRFVIRPQPVLSLPASAGPDAHPAQGDPRLAATSGRGFRWTDRSGQWIEYDNQGRITSYGDRNDVRVWFQYGSHGQAERVIDDNGRTVFTLLYTDGNAEFVSEVRDHTPLDGGIRRVRYEYDDGQLVRVHDARGHVTRFEYSGAKLSKVVDAAGRTTTIHYNAPPIPRGSYRVASSGMAAGRSSGSTSRSVVSGDGLRGEQLRRLAKIVAPDGGETEIDYDYDRLKKEFSMTVKHPETAAGRRVDHLQVDADGRLVRYEVNGNVLLTSTGSYKSGTYTDERGNQTSITRDAFGEVTSKTFPDGARATVTYESGSLDIREYVDESGSITRADYDDHGNLVRIRAAAGKAEQVSQRFEVNARGETVKVVREGGLNPAGDVDPDVEIQLGYDGNGNVTSLIDGEGHRWVYEYDAQGNLIEAIDPLGHSWTYSYDSHGNRESVTDPNGLSWGYTYDATGKPLTILDSRGKTTRATYDPVGRLATVIDPLGAVRRHEFDAEGKLIGLQDEVGQRWKAQYDAQGRMAAEFDGEGNVTSYSYADVDGVDRGGALVSLVKYPTYEQSLRYNSRLGVSRVDEQGSGRTHSAVLAYDARGLLTSLIDPYQATQSGEYDALGRPTKGKDALGHVVTLTYDRRGNVARVTDRRGKVTQLEYDRRDILVRETNPLGQVTRYIHDAAGRLSELQRPNGKRVSFTYDPAGRLETRRSYAADGSVELTDTFQWDGGNRLTGWSTVGANGVRTYDDAGNLLSEAVTINGVTLERRYTYYANGQVKTVTGPDGVALEYLYDGNGALSRLDIPGEGSVSVVSRNWTAASQILFPGGTVRDVESDDFLNTIRTRVRGPNQTVLFDQQSEYGSLHEVTRRTTHGAGVGYTYDAALQLTKTNPSSGSARTFELDPAGNRVTDSGVSGAWLYDDANRLLQQGSVTYEYDAAGNLIRRTDASASGALRATVFVYDGHNRLTEVRDGEDELVARYSYDPFGHRISKEVSARGAVRGGVEGRVLFLQSGAGVLAEVDGGGRVLRSYAWEPGSTYGTAPLFIRNGDGQYYYYHHDPLGQPWLLTNKSGAVVWQANRIDAFGAMVLAPGAQVVQPWRMPGQYLDTETGLHYNLHRYYDPQTGRYTTEDPMGRAGGLNFYLYANGSPTYYIDPTGEAPWIIILPIVWGAIELGSFLYDLYDAYHTFSDPCSTGWDRAIVAGGLLAGAALPGGGYGTAGRRFRGGSHRDMQKPTGDGLDSHHMPDRNADPNVSHLDGPAIQMERRDHTKTRSHGTQKGSAKYREKTAEMIANGDYRGAMAREIHDARRAADIGSGDRTKYNQAIREMLDYARESGQLPGNPKRKK